MDRRTKICIWIILIGLGNFLAYSILYMFIGGEAVSGVIRDEAGGRRVYCLKGPSQQDVPVSRGVYVYSGIHSITIWVTVGAVMLAMLTLARERIVSSMRSTVVRGRTLITVLATVITLTTAVLAIWFTLQFASRFAASHRAPAPTTLRADGVARRSGLWPLLSAVGATAGSGETPLLRSARRGSSPPAQFVQRLGSGQRPLLRGRSWV